MIAVLSGLAVAFLAGGTPPDMLGGRAWLWGTWLGICAILMTLRNSHLDAIGTLAACVWMNLWMTGFFIAATKDNTVALAAAGVACGGYGALSAALFAQRVGELRKIRATRKGAG